ICFFFSSRRRHTISKRDWSSDVCSSDLRPVALQPTHHPILLVVHVIYDNFPILPIDIDIVGGSAKEICNFLSRNVHVIIFFEQRSEERRVGKECRFRWWE